MIASLAGLIPAYSRFCREATCFAHAGRVLNVAVSAADTNEPPRVLNYLTSPNVVIWSAVSCSSAFPYLFKPQELLSKDEKGNMCG